MTRNERAFRVMVRNEAFRRVELCAVRNWTVLGELDAESGWDADRWASALEPYFAEHEIVRTGQDARSSALFDLDGWTVRQTLADPDGFNEWAIVLDVDVEASESEGVAVLRPREVVRLGSVNGR